MTKNIKKTFIINILVCLIINFAYCSEDVITYAKEKETIYVGMFQNPILEGQRVEFYAIANNFENPLFRVFISDGKKEYELTDKYIHGIKEEGYYRINLDNLFLKGNYKLKVWIKDKKSLNVYDSEKYINNVNVIMDKNYDKNLILPINVVNVSNNSNETIKELVDLNIKDSSNENSNTGSNLDKIKVRDYDIKDKIQDEWNKESSKIVEQALLNQDQIIANQDIYQNLVGNKFCIKYKNLNIENELDTKKYKYKLHVYDVTNNTWIYDKNNYGEVYDWIAERPGIYLLDLWTVKNNSLKQNKKYDSWRIVPIIIQEKPIVEIDSIISSHSPIYENDKVSFYAKSRNAEKVQYRAWIISAETQEIMDISNGYSNIVSSKDYYKIDMDKNLKPGDYFLWLRVRDVNSRKSYDNYFAYKFTALKNENKHEATISNDMIFSTNEFRTGKETILEGIDDILGSKYKLNIYDIEEDKWTSINENYMDKVSWVPEKSGQYLISLWIKNGNKHIPKINEEYDSIKLKIINVYDEGHQLEKDDKKIKYTVVNDFEELYSSIEKGYKLLIYNPKVKETYLKCISVLNEMLNINMNELERVMAVHDYIVRNTRYASGDYLVNKDDKDIYNAYGVLLNNIAVCQGYADTFKMMLDILKIDNCVVQGMAVYPNVVQEHAWNLVKIDDAYYHIDSTWNDSIGNSEDHVSYKYFLMNDEDMKEDHKWCTKGKYPKSNSNKYKYFREIYEGTIDKGWIYYSSSYDEYALYKIRVNGKNRVKLEGSSVVEINLDKNWIYFSNYSFGGYLFKIRKDGLGITKLNEDYSSNIMIKGKYIIYYNEDDKEHYQILKDGSERLRIDIK